MRRSLAIVAAALVVAGCAGAGRAPVAHDAASRLAPAGPSPWREDFGDPTLRGLLAEADRQNLDIKLALARLARADAEAGLAQGESRVHAEVGLEAAEGAPRSGKPRNRGAPSLETTYELDLFGRLKSAAQAAAAEGRASAIDVEGARLLVGAETARTYAALAMARRADEAAAERECAADRALALVSLRAQAGRATSGELEARRQALDEARLQRRLAAAEADRQRNRLTVLLGRTELVPVPPPAAFQAPSSPPAAVASDAVAARPDVRAAYQRLAAADAHRAEAVAASRPKFMLSLAAGAVDPAIANLLNVKSLVWAAGGSITDDLLDRRSSRARIRGAQAGVDAADLAYRKAVVEAWAEARAALVDEAAARDAAAVAERGLERARAELTTLERRHSAGAADGVDLAAGQDQLARAVQAAAEARGKVLAARVQLALALGGGA